MVELEEKQCLSWRKNGEEEGERKCGVGGEKKLDWRREKVGFGGRMETSEEKAKVE